MKFLFIHSRFPGNAKHLINHLIEQQHEIVVLTMKLPPNDKQFPGVRFFQYEYPNIKGDDTHPWIYDIETRVQCGEIIFHKIAALREQGFIPDIVIAHPSLGESLFIKDILPQVPLGIYCDLIINVKGQAIGFDSEFDIVPQSHEVRSAQIYLHNSTYFMQMERANTAIAETRFHANSYPRPFHPKISIINSGVDTNLFKPRVDFSIQLPSVVGHYQLFTPGGAAVSAQNVTFNKGDEIITVVCRNFEPARGCHILFRILPELLQRRTRAHVILSGVDGQSFNKRPDNYESWRQQFWTEIEPKLTVEAKSRIHFVGILPEDKLASLLQLSTVNLYLSYPVIVGNELLQAMSCGCAIIASNVAPVREFIENGTNGILIDFFDKENLLERIIYLLKNDKLRHLLGMRARQFILERYDVQTRSLPTQIKWINKLFASR